MKAVSKKLLSLLLVAILLVSAFPFHAAATEWDLGEEVVEEITDTVPMAAGDQYVTLHADGYAGGTLVEATVKGGETWSTKVVKGESIGVLENAVPENSTDYSFAGWYTEPKGQGTKVVSNTAWDGSYTDLYAKFNNKANSLTIKVIINDDVANATVISSYNVAPSNNLLNYLNGIKGEIEAILAADYAGYYWYGPYWYDYSGKIPLNSQDQTLAEHQVVCVKLYSNEYRLDFNAGEGKVDPTSKTVKYNQAVGTLPTPTRNNYLFRGWYADENYSANKKYTSSTVYKTLGNTILYAKWAKQEKVVLEIYLNGNTSDPDRCPVLSGYAAGDKITQQDVEAIVKQYYSAKSGTTLTLQGLYDSNTWKNYLKNNNEAGSPSVEIEGGTTNYVYVMVNNAKQGATPSTNNTTPPATKPATPADPSNPKTGDNNMIFTAMTVMLLAGAALITLEEMRKRKMI